MPRLTETAPPVTDTQLARSIASWLRRVPARTLVELAATDSRDNAAAAIAEMITAEMAEAYPKLVEPSAPPLPF